jgi:5-formaminoimidazole-4-carboxamide-1-beta-D-ribofuranosyl 5'-monophosphate synthetase
MKSEEDIKESEIEKMIWGKNVPQGFKYSEVEEEEEKRESGYKKKKAKK